MYQNIGGSRVEVSIQNKFHIALFVFPIGLCLTSSSCPNFTIFGLIGLDIILRDIQTETRNIFWEYMPAITDEGPFSCQQGFRIAYEITNIDSKPGTDFKTIVQVDYAGGCSNDYKHHMVLPPLYNPYLYLPDLYYHGDLIHPGESAKYTIYPTTTEALGGFSIVNALRDTWQAKCKDGEILNVTLI